MSSSTSSPASAPVASSATVRTILPLAFVTCTSMLAMDLYLPAVPALQRGLGLSVAQGQASVAIFLAGLAASQLVWGEALHRFGPRGCVRTGVLVLILSTVGCALANGFAMLLAMRLLQGIAAGAATVVAPTVIRATLPDRDGVRGMAAIAMIEALVPAAGPALGTLLLLALDWRGTFWVIAALVAIAGPSALRATPQQLPGHDAAVTTGYRALLRSPRYLRIALSHALCFGALLCFVASGPQALRDALGTNGVAFVVAQVCSVAAFIVVASQSGRISARIGAPRAVQLGALAQALLCAGFLLACVADNPPFAVVLGFWVLFCASLAIRGPAAFAEALAVPAAQMGRASALLVLTVLVAGALATQAAALFLDQIGLRAVATTMALLCTASLALVVPYPRAQTKDRPA